MPVSVTHVFEALSILGGEAHLTDIEKIVREIAEPPLPISTPNVIRGRLQQFSSDAQSYTGGPDLFESVYGVNARKGVWRLRDDSLEPSNRDLSFDGEDKDFEVTEGALFRSHLRRERSRSLISKFKAALSSFECRICGFDFEKQYGEMGRGFIEAHHKLPISMIEPGAATRLSDLIAVCSNCHRMLHRGKVSEWQELKEALRGEGN